MQMSLAVVLLVQALLVVVWLAIVSPVLVWLTMASLVVVLKCHSLWWCGFSILINPCGELCGCQDISLAVYLNTEYYTYISTFIVSAAVAGRTYLCT